MIRLFGVLVHRAMPALLVVDICVITAAFLTSVAVRLGEGALSGYVGTHLNLLSAMLLIYCVCFYVADLYDTKRDFRKGENVLHILAACVVGMVATAVFFYAGTKQVGRGIFLMTGAMVFLLTVVTRSAFIEFQSSRRWQKRVLVAGAGLAGHKLMKSILDNNHCGFWVVGFVDDDPAKSGHSVYGKPVLGTTSDIIRLAGELDIDMIALCMERSKNEEMFKTLIKCHYQNITVVDMPTLFEGITGKLPLQHINHEWLLFAVMSSRMLMFYNIKRFADVALSLALLVMTLPVMLLTAILIKLDSKGDVFFVQERVGKNYKKFTLYKFRTMVQDAERHTGAVWATKDDPRVTRVGRYLRKFRVDELPQLINVIMGEMSFVGPRPEREVFVNELEKHLPAYTHRLMVKPGLTGWAQVMYAYAATKDEAMEKLRYDLYYVKNMSILLDLLIVLKTVRTVLTSKGH